MCLIPVSGASLALSDTISDARRTGTQPTPSGHIKKNSILRISQEIIICWDVFCSDDARASGYCCSAACNNPAVITIIQSEPLSSVASEPIFAASSSRVENRKIPETMWHYWLWWHLLLPDLVTMGPVVSRHLFVWQPRPGTGAVTLSAWPEFVTRCHAASRVTFPSRMWRQYF